MYTAVISESSCIRIVRDICSKLNSGDSCLVETLLVQSWFHRKEYHTPQTVIPRIDILRVNMAVAMRPYLRHYVLSMILEQ